MVDLLKEILPVDGRIEHQIRRKIRLSVTEHDAPFEDPKDGSLFQPDEILAIQLISAAKCAERNCSGSSLQLHPKLSGKGTRFHGTAKRQGFR